MAKRQINGPQARPLLEKTREEFKTQLEERLDLGTEILQLTDVNELTENFYRWNDFNIEFLKQAFDNPNSEYRDDYEHAGYGPFGALSNHAWNTMAEKRETLGYKLNSLKDLIAKVSLIRVSGNIENLQNQNATAKPASARDLKEVFIVHGHDDSAKNKVARFIEKLGLKPIILHEQASNGKTIIEKIEAYSNVGFGIVLYTPCDLGGKTRDELQSRARQNVVFEHGYLIGKIGRNHVTALVKGNIETPNDISGVVYVSMDEAGAWQFQIAKEMKSCDYQIDMNSLL